jgi:hypothetical protein
MDNNSVEKAEALMKAVPAGMLTLIFILWIACMLAWLIFPFLVWFRLGRIARALEVKKEMSPW